MASISSLSGSTSNSSSIYGNRTYNIISGLASGLDTESLISGVVQSYQQKIQSLQQKNTKIQWQQESIQNISNMLVEFERNYATYAYSNTNLASSSFFNNAVITTANGTFSDLVSASGKSSSSIILNSVSKLATAAQCITSANRLDGSIKLSSDSKQVTATASGALDFSDTKLSTLSGSLTLTYGASKVTIRFDDGELFEKADGSFDADAYKSAIEKKLKEQQISTSSGSTFTADTRIGVDVSEDGTVSFYDKMPDSGNGVTITSATGKLEDMIENGVPGDASSMKLSLTKDDASNRYTGATEVITAKEYLDGKYITVTFDGKSKSIALPTADDNFVSNLNQALSDAFGSGKVTVGTTDGKLSFTTNNGSTLSVAASDSGVGNILGIGSSLTNYLDTTKSLGDLNVSWDWTNTANAVKGTGTVTEQTDSDGNVTYVDENGKQVNKDGYLIDEDGNLYFDLTINGQKIGTYSKGSELNTVLNDINSNTEAGVKVSYSKITGQFVFSAKDTGSGGRIEIKDGLGAAIFGTIDPNDTSSSDYDYNPGQDAEISLSINGGEAMTITRSSNTFDVDGMSITLNGTFNEGADVGSIAEKDKVSFTTKTNADTIVDAVKKMVDDFNALIKEVKNAYSTMPLEKSDGSRYDPLTDDDMSDMSDSAIETYEEKAKTGILFMDSDLSSLYNELRNAITASGADGATLRSIGISTSYSDGLTTLTFDEQTFRQALETDPDKVQEAFTKSTANGSATDGLMAKLTTITERYAATTGATKGILIERAGSKYSPTAALDNTLLNQMKDVEDEISKWQTKMSDKVDYYTNKFTQLEMLINQMNSQSSALSGLLGG